MVKAFASALVAAALFSCAGHAAAPAEPAARSQKPERLGHRLELSSYLPAPGLLWLVRLEPRALFENKELRESWSSVIGGESLAAFKESSGLDPAQVGELWIAGYALGTLLLYDASQVGSAAEESFLKRSLTSAQVQRESSDLTHFTGMMDKRPHALVHLKGHFIAIADGDLGLAKIVAAYAEGELTQSKSALETRFASPIASFGAGAPVRAFLFGPFPDATDAVAQSFVSGALSVQPEGHSLHIRGTALGLWQSEEIPTLGPWLTQVLGTRELRALGMGFPQKLGTVTCKAPQDEWLAQRQLSLCSVSTEFNSKDVADSVHRITAGSMSELSSASTPSGWQSHSLSENPGATPPPAARGTTASPSTNESEPPAP